MKNMKRADIPERIRPGEPEPLRGSPGSIEQQLDMVEGSELRGDEVQFTHGVDAETDEADSDPRPLDEIMMNNFNTDMSEADREGDEMSGDDHSSGLQGGEPDIENQEHIDTGIPGDETSHQELRGRKRNVA